MKKILIVDDAVFMRNMLKSCLDDEEICFIEASSGNEALEMQEQNKCDLIIMDITMPGLSGIDAVKKIRENDKNTKIIMCTAMGQQCSVMDSIMAGANSFIVKPFQKDLMKKTVMKLLE